jgi:hypothetical protein
MGDEASRRTAHLLALCVLFVGLVSTVWKIGVVVHDDAGWVLDTLHSGFKDAWEWAVAQGRLYALPDGLMMLQAYRRDGTVFGEVLKFGSFALALLGIGAVLRSYWGERIALLSLSLFFGLLALQFDYGSALLAYPLLIWPAVVMGTIAILAGRRYAAGAARGWLALAAFTSFLSFFTNEGMTLSLAALTGLCWAGTVFERPGHRPIRRDVALGAAFAAALVLYLASTVAFHAWHPSDYEGTKLAKFDLGKILGVLGTFTTSASDFHALFQPYTIVFSDHIAQHTASRVRYSLGESFSDLGGAFAPFLQALIFGWLCWSLLRRHEDAVPGSARLAEGSVVLPGLILMLLPILPVALIDRYQEQHGKFGVDAYLTTIVSQFGLSIMLAGVLVSLVRRTGRARPAVVLLFVGTLAVLSFAGLRTNERIAGDIRPEAGRWQVLRQTMPLLQATGWGSERLLAPQLQNGGWFAVMTPDYWSDYVSTYSGMKVSVVYDAPTASEPPHGTAELSYVPSEDRRAFDLVLGHRAMTGDSRPVIDRIAVQIGHHADSEITSLVLSYLDRGQIFHQVHLRDLRRDPADGWRFYLDAADAVPGSIRLMRQTMPAE